MALSEFLFASGELVHRLESGLLYAGAGRIYVAKPDPKGVDASLWGALKVSVDELRLAIHVNSITTGQHVPASRHFSGRAVDINRMGAVEGVMTQTTLANEHALELVKFLRQNGWHIGEGGPWPGLFLGPVHTALNPSAVPHDTHLHVSLPNRPAAGGNEAEQEEALDCEPEED